MEDIYKCVKLVYDETVLKLKDIQCFVHLVLESSSPCKQHLQDRPAWCKENLNLTLAQCMQKELQDDTE